MIDFENLRGERLRRFIAVAAIAVTVYYLYWRVTETFNPNALLFSWVLYVAELFGFITTFLFYFSVWKPISRTPPPPIPDRRVDVLIPTYNESVSVLRKTLLACNDLTYPHRTLVLDDGDRPEVEALCGELGCVYMARGSNKDAKAGNINFGLEHSDAEFIAVFDADHAPLPRFIESLIGYFEDEKVGFVQTPQEFYNIDSFMHRVDYKKKYIWGEQGLFYSLIQPGRDHWNAAYFVGSCALMRREALDDIGGFATGSITEDMMTSIRIHSKGWSSVYHNEELAYGIAAETILPFHIQRKRWGLGGWQVFFKANPMFIRGLSFPQRLCYLASLIYPIEGFQKLIFYLTPPIVLFTGVLPMEALDLNYLLHFVPYYAISLYAFNEMGRGYGGNLMLEQFSMGKFATYIGSFCTLLIPGSSKRFDVTPKGKHSASPYRLLTPQIAVCILSIAAIVWALAQLLLQMRNDDFIVAVNSLWALYNSGLGIAIIQYAKRKIFQRRDDFRIPDLVPVLYRFNGDGNGTRRLAVAENLTGKGMSVLSMGKFPTGGEVEFEIDVPNRRIKLYGSVVHEETITAKNHLISRCGVIFSGKPAGQVDVLSRYLSESSISKFLGEFSKRYMTFIDRKLKSRKPHKKRAARSISYLPAFVKNGEDHSSLGVIKNMSESGILLATKDHLQVGKRVTVIAVIETEFFILEGIATRVQPHESRHFPEYLAGIQLTKPHSEDINYILGLIEQSKSLLY